MSVTEEPTARRRINLAWAAALVLYGACWVLPILDPVEGGIRIGFDGARFADELFWELVTKGRS